MTKLSPRDTRDLDSVFAHAVGTLRQVANEHRFVRRSYASDPFVPQPIADHLQDYAVRLEGLAKRLHAIRSDY
jgi:hypothetical protein